MIKQHVLLSLLRRCLRSSLVLLATLPVAMSLFSACEQQRDPCLQPTTAYLRARTLLPATGATRSDSLLPSARWIAIDAQAVLLFPPRTSLFRLTLNPNADSTRFILQPDSASLSVDTVILFYDRSLQFLSNACGYTYFYAIRNVTHTQYNIDSVRINNDEVNGNVNTPDHVQILF